MGSILFDPLCFWISPAGQKHGQEEKWLGKQELKKKGEETLGDETTGRWPWWKMGGKTATWFRQWMMKMLWTNVTGNQSHAGVSFLYPSTTNKKHTSVAPSSVTSKSWPWMHSPAFSNMKLLCSSLSKGPHSGKCYNTCPFYLIVGPLQKAATAIDRQLECLDSWNTSLLGICLQLTKHSSYIVQLQNKGEREAPYMVT